MLQVRASEAIKDIYVMSTESQNIDTDEEQMDCLRRLIVSKNPLNLSVTWYVHWLSCFSIIIVKPKFSFSYGNNDCDSE